MWNQPYGTFRFSTTFRHLEKQKSRFPFQLPKQDFIWHFDRMVRKNWTSFMDFMYSTCSIFIHRSILHSFRMRKCLPMRCSPKKQCDCWDSSFKIYVPYHWWLEDPCHRVNDQLLLVFMILIWFYEVCTARRSAALSFVVIWTCACRGSCYCPKQ